ncbi:MAG TPA: hypothetical protein ENK49_09440 [Gammaproteobacteria bacterium]|nr:hypothetical protein [Gammaproteobacteria bacterium]
MQTRPQRYRQQQGAATLLVTLALTLSITIVTLAVARTQLVEQRMSNNDNWNTRLLLQAESGLARGMVYLVEKPDALSWSGRFDTDTETGKLQLPGRLPGTGTELRFSRNVPYRRLVSIQATARRHDGSNIQAHVSQFVRLLSVLTPRAETLPPLVIHGCLSGTPRNLDIRPQYADTDQAGEAIWSGLATRCPLPATTDLHNGSLRGLDMRGGLWPQIFSVSREEFLQLAEQEQALPEPQRRYRVAPEAGPGTRYLWRAELGSAKRPVVLYFPPGAGCPLFAPGVTIYGIVYIESSCPAPFASEDVSITGALVLDSHLDITGSTLQLNHIQLADGSRQQLDFPVLRSVPVPGTWKDF